MFCLLQFKWMSFYDTMLRIYPALYSVSDIIDQVKSSFKIAKNNCFTVPFMHNEKNESKFFCITFHHFKLYLLWSILRPVTGPALESKGMRAIFQKKGEKGKMFENLGKDVQNLKIF